MVTIQLEIDDVGELFKNGQILVVKLFPEPWESELILLGVELVKSLEFPRWNVSNKKNLISQRILYDFWEINHLLTFSSNNRDCAKTSLSHENCSPGSGIFSVT